MPSLLFMTMHCIAGNLAQAAALVTCSACGRLFVAILAAVAAACCLLVVFICLVYHALNIHQNVPVLEEVFE